MKPKISIVVPVFNVEPYLKKCIDSILNQTFKDFEVILVNDGSTDNSGQICNEYLDMDARIKVIHNKNGGLSSARNAGLSVSKGEYVGFVDSDDYISENMYEILYHHVIEAASDIVVCDLLPVEEGESHDANQVDPECTVCHYTNTQALHKLYDAKSTFVYAVNKLYRRSIFNDVAYDKGRLYEDEFIIHQLLYKSEKVTYIQATLYFYVQRAGSIVNSSFSVKKFDRVYALKQREVFFRNKNLPELHQKALKHYMEVFFWYYYLARQDLKEAGQEREELKKTFNDSLYSLMKHREIGLKQKAMFLVFRVNPALVEWIKNWSVFQGREHHSKI
ncbi:glycosyltransferase family 2 protein [Lentibacillus sediminis]|uniref:glycosyltransferase family 2 protein n=1 Tax=Lentibacillus sediminis TaxID=1940529 RepID=UPI000C1BCAF4|nr:glycosyltransferase family 2 protein [Lentibacillus sediminis]